MKIENFKDKLLFKNKKFKIEINKQVKKKKKSMI